ncbi:MAG: nucleotide-binding protein, partial [Candidatus Lokiarchaeota archaeon]|nr:nucleotide-binding protein [Candidatus Lokiarchaeota archaeon]
GLIPIILHEQPNEGKTIIEKFERYSDVGFAIILLSPDDYVSSMKNGESKKTFRARQNVILELGYFLGKLGRERTLALYKFNDQFEFPSDISGLLYLLYDNTRKWKYDLIGELKNHNYDVSKDSIR